MKLVYEGKILIVRDYENNLQAYINPEYYIKYCEKNELDINNSIIKEYEENTMREIATLINDAKNYENFNLGGRSYVKKYKRR